MLFQRRLTTAGVTLLAGAVAGFMVFASPASARPDGSASQPTTLTASESPVAVATTATNPTPTTPTPTAEEAKGKKKDPCAAGAALDSESGKWRATVSCDDWTAVLPGTYETRQEALDNAEGWTRGVNSKVMDGPGCNPPFVLC